METTHVSIKGVSKSFGRMKALNDVSLDIPRGSFTTFLGPSGCGKTTLLRTIAGFYRLEEGMIRIGDRVINDVPSHLRNAVMVFQDYALFPHMTIRDNITYGLRIKKTPADEVERRLGRTVEYLGIGGLLDRSPGQISGGQQQRAALARALVMEPEVLLLDEPLSNLDAKLRVNIRAELRQLQQRLKITTVYVTHDQAEALSLSDHIAVMNEGRIVQYGTPGEVYYRPVSPFVASFVGTVNFVDGTVEETNRNSEGMLSVKVRAGSDLIVLEDAVPRRTLVRGDSVTLCIRPETVRLAGPRDLPDAARFRGRVRNFIFEGASIRYWIEWQGRDLVVDVFDPGEGDLCGKEVDFVLNPKRIHILAADKGALNG